MNSYEARRLEKIKKNQALLAELDIKPIVPKPERDAEGKPPTKRRKTTPKEPTAPSRTSARIAAAPIKPVYDDEPDIRPSGNRRAEGGAKQAPQQPAVQSSLPAKDVDSMIANWTTWKPTGSPPSRDPETKVLHFPDAHLFTPNKTPEEMIREGAFGGSYYRPLRSAKLGRTISGDYAQDLPSSWLTHLDVSRYLTNPTYDPSANKFRVSCGQSIEEWEAAGWIAHEYDVRGWFQWYVRFYQGRRCEDDERQIGRWRKCVGATGRWRRMLLKKYVQMGVREVFDDGEEEDGKEVSPVMHQTCHHWAYEVRQGDLERYWETGE